MSRAWFALAVVAVLGLFYVGAVTGQRPGGAKGVTWEVLANPRDGDSRIARTKIPGGWLVETSRQSPFDSRSSGIGVGLAFVPDPEHKWDGNSLP